MSLTIPVSGSGGGTTSQQVTGNVASGATDSGNPVKTGGKYNATLPTVTDGQRVDTQSSQYGTTFTGLALWPVTDLTRVLVNTASSGDTTLVTGTASQTTKVYRLRLSVAGAVIVKLTDGGSGTVLEKWNFAGNGGAVIYDLSDRPYCKTSAATALVINLSAAVQVDGVVEYIKSA